MFFTCRGNDREAKLFRIIHERNSQDESFLFDAKIRRKNTFHTYNYKKNIL